MPQERPKLTPKDKINWNRFIDFVALQKMADNPILDQRNKQVGMSLLQKYNLANPKNALPNDVVPMVQQEIHDYRNSLINQWKAGKIKVDGVKDENDIMPNISPIDGWPGRKTLSHRFPVAKEVVNGEVIKDYKTDVGAFDKDRGLASN